MKVLLVLFALCAVAQCIHMRELDKIGRSSGTMEMRDKLRKKLLREHDRFNIPDDVKCKLGLNLINVELDEDKELMNADVYIPMMWNDKRLVWDKSATNIDLLRVNYDEIWKPDITLFNGLKFDEMLHCHKTMMIVFHTGDVVWVPQCRIKVHCNTTIKEHPMEKQICKIKFGSWVFDKKLFDLEFLEDKKEIDTEFFQTTKWKIITTTGTKHEKVYPGLKETFTDLTFKVVLQKVVRKEMCMRHD